MLNIRFYYHIMTIGIDVLIKSVTWSLIIRYLFAFYLPKTKLC